MNLADARKGMLLTLVDDYKYFVSVAHHCDFRTGDMIPWLEVRGMSDMYTQRPGAIRRNVIVYLGSEISPEEHDGSIDIICSALFNGIVVHINNNNWRYIKEMK